MRFLPAVYFLLLMFSACNMPLDQKKLVGTWDYIKVENLNPQEEDSTTTADLKEAKPYIQFSEKGELRIFWSGQLLSSGTYHLEGKMIRYKEDLPDGRHREFPFLVSKLSEKELLFETMSREGTRVTAVKRP